MRQQSGLAQNQFTHGFKIVQGGMIAEAVKRLSHFGKDELGFIAKTEKRFGAAEVFSRTTDGEGFIWTPGVRAGLAGGTAADGVAAVVAAEVRPREENIP